jgi:hypothetical protein
MTAARPDPARITSGTDQAAPVGELPGGERRRVRLGPGALGGTAAGPGAAVTGTRSRAGSA